MKRTLIGVLVAAWTIAQAVALSIYAWTGATIPGALRDTGARAAWALLLWVVIETATAIRAMNDEQRHPRRRLLLGPSPDSGVDLARSWMNIRGPCASTGAPVQQPTSAPPPPAPAHPMLPVLPPNLFGSAPIRPSRILVV